MSVEPQTPNDEFRQPGEEPAKKASLLPHAPGTSWLILLVTTLAILMTAIDGGILPAVLPAGYGEDACLMERALRD